MKSKGDVAGLVSERACEFFSFKICCCVYTLSLFGELHPTFFLLSVLADARVSDASDLLPQRKA